MNSLRRGVQPLPMWARWLLAVVVGVAVIAGIVIVLDRAGPDGATSEAGAQAEVNRLADIAITKDQAPHVAGLSPNSEPAGALEQAIARDVRRRIASGQLTGPLQGVTCGVAGTGSTGRDPFHCAVHSDGIAYTFLAVVDERRQRLTWCKIDQAPVGEAGPEIPISTSCRA
jgi:hypothetical protein